MNILGPRGKAPNFCVIHFNLSGSHHGFNLRSRELGNWSWIPEAEEVVVFWQNFDPGCIAH